MYSTYIYVPNYIYITLIKKFGYIGYRLHAKGRFLGVLPVPKHLKILGTLGTF